jgi:hypothetical protein
MIGQPLLNTVSGATSQCVLAACLVENVVAFLILGPT